MTILAIDDEELALIGLVNSIKAAAPGVNVISFRDGEKAMEEVDLKDVDVAFLDIEMAGVHGVDLGRKFLSINPRLNLIFTTGYREYMEEAFDLHVSGYVLKPVTPEKIKKEFENLRYEIHNDAGTGRLYVRTFGEFEIFYNGAPVQFGYARSKELIAVLVDNYGAMMTIGKIEDTLWEDDLSRHDSYIRNLLADITQTFKKYGQGDVIIRRRGIVGIDPTKIDCDYYDLLRSKTPKQSGFSGEYMAQYSWGEVTLGKLLRLCDME